jgi:O-antigen biosynthesis rhamnosyltransferase
VAHDETCLVVPAADTGAAAAALNRLADDPARAREMGERGRARQRARFSGEAMVDGYLSALEEVAVR